MILCEVANQYPSEKAEVVYINVSSTDGPIPDYVQTTVTFKGAPYPLTGGNVIQDTDCLSADNTRLVFVGESALTILFDHDHLSDMGKQGGVLTPISALGDSLLRRLVSSGFVTYETKTLHSNQTKKTV